MRVAVLTSGGDAPGMNAAVRAVVRAGLAQGCEVYAVHEGYRGLVQGGDLVRRAAWGDVSDVLRRGGTVLGTARCQQFRTREGRRAAARTLVQTGVDKLVVVGGDGSLTGADIFRREWTSLLSELISSGELSAEEAGRHPALSVVGLVGSIDNDMAGTDMTIGTDTALHRITEAIDAITSTAVSHRRAFVVEVMGRHCGYLALMGALAGEADWVILPEHPPAGAEWEADMIASLEAGNESGRRDSIVVIAEGARDREGNTITSEHVREVLQRGLGVEVRTTVLGHVQRGGAPSAYDRNLGTLLGHAALQLLLEREIAEPVVLGVHGNRLVQATLSECLATNQAIGEAIAARDYEAALRLRGGSFAETWRVFRSLAHAAPSRELPAGQRPLRLGVLTAGAPAPGMNAAVHAAVRLGIDRGHEVVGVRNGFQGLIGRELSVLGWSDVAGWAPWGGSELGTRRNTLAPRDMYAITRTVEEEGLDGLMVIGGWSAYSAAARLHTEREHYPAFDVPVLCLPATINNNMPGSELSIGADTALNAIVSAVDKVRRSASAQQRCFVVEVMGRWCGYLALMTGMATGAERVYLHEEGVTLRDLQADLDRLVAGFRRGKRLGLVVRNERANRIYDARFMAALFEEEGGDLFDVRVAVLGHLQQGGDPSPFDRIHATRLAAHGIEHLSEHAAARRPAGAYLGIEQGELRFHELGDFHREVDVAHQRPREQWWMALRPIASMLARADARVG